VAKSKTTPKKKAAAKDVAKNPKKAVKKKTSKEAVVVDRRRTDRRNEDDRRQETLEVEQERRELPERRKKVNRRRQIDPTTCERDYNEDEIQFMHAMDTYKRAAGRMFPTCSEILEVLRDLGYRRLTPEELAKLAPPQPELAEGVTEGEHVDLQASDLNEANAKEPWEETLDDFEG